MSTFIIVLSFFAVCMALPPSYTSPKFQQPTPLEPKQAPIQDDLEWLLEHGFGSRQENMHNLHFNNPDQENHHQQLTADKHLRNFPEQINQFQRQKSDKIVMNLDDNQNQDSQQEFGEKLIVKKSEQEQKLQEGENMSIQRQSQKELKKQQPNGQIQKIQSQKQQQWMGKDNEEQEEFKQNQHKNSWMSTKVLTNDDMAEIKPEQKKNDQERQGMKSITLLEDSKESDEEHFDFNRHHGMKVQNQMKPRHQRESLENDSHALMNTIYKN